MVVLFDPFQGMGVQRNSMDTQLPGNSSRSGPKVKNEKSSAKNGASKRLRCVISGNFSRAHGGVGGHKIRFSLEV